jgi:uncharacterized protein YlxW (UPF0749 family)
MSALETAQAELERLEGERDGMQGNIDSFELDESDYEDQYIECIDSEGAVMVAGMAFTASRILQELDPIAYNCGLTDYVDGIDKEEEDDYKELVEELESLETQIITLEEEIEEMEEDED